MKRFVPAPRATAFMGVLALLGLVVLSATLGYTWTERRGFERLDDAAAHQLELYAAVLEIELGKQADLPGLVDIDGEVEAVLRRPTDAALRAAVNRKLTRFVARSGALWAGAVDAQGRVVASSDAYRSDSRLDHVASNEPCIAEAVAGQEAQRFAPDRVRGVPEVCFARPLQREGRVLGAVAVQMSLEPIEASWIDAAFRADSEKPLIVDAQGIVIMSSVPSWRFLPLAAVSVPQRSLAHGAQLVRLRASPAEVPGVHVLHERPLTRFGWNLMVLSSAADVARDARTAAWGAGALAVCAGLVIVLLRQRRRVIAQRLAARAALQRANDELELKVQQRTAELMQAGKLALLGQLSAGISHELGQPLTALRALAENGRLLLERGRAQQAGENFASITGLAERMGRITSQLKSFARKSPDTVRPVALEEAVANARQLIATRLDAEQVELAVELPEGLAVQCDGHRLEQVLVNLMVNAIDAMRGSPGPHRLNVAATAMGERIVVRVADNGPGIPPALSERLFEPFFTTKPPGEGLGLGLVISAHIVREFGGVLRSVAAPHGAVFEFDLAPAAMEASHV